jgi:hypothetical protein
VLPSAPGFGRVPGRVPHWHDELGPLTFKLTVHWHEKMIAGTVTATVPVTATATVTVAAGVVSESRVSD